MAPRKFKHHFIFYPARLLMALLGVLPARMVSVLGRCFGSVVFVLAGGERHKTIATIKTAYSSALNEAQVQKLARSVWVGLGQTLFETVSWRKWTREKIAAKVARVHGMDHLDNALLRGKGALVVTAHLGNWELLGAYLSVRYPVTGVAQEMYDSRFDQIVRDFREKTLGVEMVKRGMALRGILEALKRNRLIVALCDQDTGRDGVFVPFFGKPAWTQSGVARIAQKTGASIIPAFVARGADGRFELNLEKEIEVPDTGDKEKDAVETVRRYTEVIETYVRAYPDQWMWMHQRWKTRPPEEEK